MVGSAAPRAGNSTERTVWQDPWPQIGAGGYAYTGIEEPEHPGRGRDLVRVPGSRRRAGSRRGRPARWPGPWAAEALRIAAWRPRFGSETDEKTIPHELDLLRTAVHLSKGCYKGQETMARVHNLGHPPRRLVFLHLDGSQHTLPAPGSDVLLGGRRRSDGHDLRGPAPRDGPDRPRRGQAQRWIPAAQLVVVDGEETLCAAQEVIVAPGRRPGRRPSAERLPARPPLAAQADR